MTGHASGCVGSGHVWSYDFVEDITHNGRKYRMLNIIDEYSRECLAMVPQRRFRSDIWPSSPTCSSSRNT